MHTQTPNWHMPCMVQGNLPDLCLPFTMMYVHFVRVKRLKLQLSKEIEVATWPTLHPLNLEPNTEQVSKNSTFFFFKY